MAKSQWAILPPKSTDLGSILTLASKPKGFCVKILSRQGTATGTKFCTDAQSYQHTPTRP